MLSIFICGKHSHSGRGKFEFFARLCSLWKIHRIWSSIPLPLRCDEIKMKVFVDHKKATNGNGDEERQCAWTREREIERERITACVSKNAIKLIQER